MRTSLIFFLMMVAQMLNAQQPKPIKSWAAGITTNMAIPGSSYLALQPCVELQLQNRFSLVGGYSFKLIKLDVSETTVTNQKYGRFLLEGRYRFTKNVNKPAFYSSLQLTRSFRKFTKTNGYFLYEFDDDSTTYFTKANVSSPVSTASLQLGFNSRGKKKFFIDLFAGMGVRFTHSKFKDIEGKTRQRDLVVVPFNWDSGLEVGKPASFFHVTAGLRFFYRIQ